MNLYHWIALIAFLDVAVILFVRGADQRRDWPHGGATKLEAEA